MKEKLIIKNFGLIKEVELELGRFNILIGEQATGKSTVAKLLAVCRYFSYIVNTSLAGSSHNFWYGLEAWGLEESWREKSFIFYENKHYRLTVQHEYSSSQGESKEGEVQDNVEPFLATQLIPVSEEFQTLLSELEKIRPELKKGTLSTKTISWTIPTSFFQNDVAAVMDNPFYLPAERGLQSIFSLGKSSIQNLSDALFTQLAKMDGIARLFTSETPIEPVDIIYKNVNGRGYIRKTSEETFYSLFNAATGYQSIIPIVLSVKYYNLIRKKRKTLIIEEPELNLFPDAQYRLIEYLVDAILNNGNTLLLTTHSPYILTSLNNLIYAAQIGRTHSEGVEKIIAKRFWLDANKVSAYRLLKDGTAKNIMDTEQNQIDVEQIDEVSEGLSKNWHKIADLEFSN